VFNLATTNHTPNYNLSQYAATDPVKILTNYNADMAAIDTAIKAAEDQAVGAVPSSRTIAGLALSENLTLAQLITAGLAQGSNGDALNALKLGGVDAANFPQISAGTWAPTYYAGTTPVNVTTTLASYVKTGKMVLITLAAGTSDAISDPGALTIGGLPIPPILDGTSAVYANTANKPITVRSEGTKLYFHVNSNIPATKADMTDFSYIRLSIIYEVA
jgi:hypothetical protein